VVSNGQTSVDRVADILHELPLGEWGWKLQFLNAQVGFVSLEHFNAGAILKTTDGGLTWKRIVVNDLQQNANLEGIGFVDENHGWGDASFRRRSSSETIDGGLTGGMRTKSVKRSITSGSLAIRLPSAMPRARRCINTHPNRCRPLWWL
jgi:hypothetical protein